MVERLRVQPLEPQRSSTISATRRLCGFRLKTKPLEPWIFQLKRK